MNDSAFLFWLHDRLINVYGENLNVDFVQKLKSLACRLEVDEDYRDRLINRQPD